jgi:hypothetical protein
VDYCSVDAEENSTEICTTVAGVHINDLGLSITTSIGLFRETVAHEFLSLLTLQGLFARLFIARLHLILLSVLAASASLRLGGETFLHKGLPFLAFPLAKLLRIRLFVAGIHLILLDRRGHGERSHFRLIPIRSS